MPQRHVRINPSQQLISLLGMLSTKFTVWFCISLPEFLSSILIMQSPLKRQID